MIILIGFIAGLVTGIALMLGIAVTLKKKSKTKIKRPNKASFFKQIYTRQRFVCTGTKKFLFFKLFSILIV